MDVLPVADERKDKEDECDQKQARRFRRIECVAMVFVGVIVVRLRHEPIVALRVGQACCRDAKLRRRAGKQPQNRALRSV